MSGLDDSSPSHDTLSKEEFYDAWIKAVKDEYRPFQTIVEDDHEGFDENGDWHAVPDHRLEAYAEVADVIVFFGLEGVEVIDGN